ncbi:MAG: hypothetical protein ACE5NW_16875 [Acidiferrobacterales bacterium]
MSNFIEFLKPRWPPFIIAFIAGPLFFMWIGWLVPGGEIAKAETKALVSYKAQRCVKRALADPEVTPDMLNEFSKRREIADKHAVMPGDEKADPGVSSECNSLLAAKA